MIASENFGQTTCPYCGVGCGVDATVVAGKVTNVVGAQHPANLGRLCVKGSALHETLGEQGRLLHPRIQGARTDWGTALDHVAAKFKETIRDHGPDSVAFYLSGQLLTEDYYVANKLMKGFIGSSNVDTNSRLCMASAVAGYKRAFGADVVPCNYEDLECCDLLIMAGSNAAWTHPVLYQRISAAKKANPRMRIVVIDPRRTATCDIADLHLALKPGADAFLFIGLLHYLNKRRAIDHDFIDAHTEGFDAAIDASASFDLEESATCTGLDIGDLEQFYQWFSRTEKTVSFYSQGINQSATGTDKCNAIINCHLATGRIGKPGMGPFSITGQPNAMGGREVGGLANQLAAHMDFNADDVQCVSEFWDAPNIARTPGLKAVDLFDAIEQGKIKAVWIMATNPVVSLPDTERVRAALQQCEFVVVSDCIAETDTNACANVLLPATGWSEKDGTVTNSERRISRQRALLPAMGEAKHDWWIIAEVAKRLGFRQAFEYSSPRDIFVEHAALSGYKNAGTRAFDIGALATLDALAYDALSPVQWPVTADSPNGSARMFTDNRFFTPNGRARFVPCTPSLPERAASFDTPFQLNTGRLRDQWHTMTRTGRSSRLMAHTSMPFIALNPRDAQSKGIRAGDLVQVFTHRPDAPKRTLLLEAQIDKGLRDGNVFAPIHWNSQFASHGSISTLIDSVTDPISGQPESKFAQVGLNAAAVQRWVAVFSRKLIDTTLFDFWVRTPINDGHLYLLADTESKIESTSSDWQQWLQSLNQGLEKIEVSNSIKDSFRVLYCNATQIQSAVFSSPSRSTLPDTAWFESLASHTLSSQTWRLLDQRHSSSMTSQRIICSCFRVSQAEIESAIAQGANSAEALGQQLRCGTNCGSCIPELKQLIAEQL
ncbi:MAG: nitrate reductase [Gammaproteobacteria bacterium]